MNRIRRNTGNSDANEQNQPRTPGSRTQQSPYELSATPILLNMLPRSGGSTYGPRSGSSNPASGSRTYHAVADTWGAVSQDVSQQSWRDQHPSGGRDSQGLFTPSHRGDQRDPQSLGAPSDGAQPQSGASNSPAEAEGAGIRFYGGNRTFPRPPFPDGPAFSQGGGPYTSYLLPHSTHSQTNAALSPGSIAIAQALGEARQPFPDAIERYNAGVETWIRQYTLLPPRDVLYTTELNTALNGVTVRNVVGGMLNHPGERPLLLIATLQHALWDEMHASRLFEDFDEDLGVQFDNLIQQRQATHRSNTTRLRDLTNQIVELVTAHHEHPLFVHSFTDLWPTGIATRAASLLPSFIPNHLFPTAAVDLTHIVRHGLLLSFRLYSNAQRYWVVEWLPLPLTYRPEIIRNRSVAHHQINPENPTNGVRLVMTPVYRMAQLGDGVAEVGEMGVRWRADVSL
ncbi:hypothetical protein LTS18_010653 [Coniosporium uncinatum]|uniref:Uncharacterized protein n=1 Tax=Coniosporium uncinatum TaxID=93489 RepID=A0ACC3DZD6_9PEZI|nr:hypothetical protein LTS18_010653 [Coniosporium uncinatum]